MLVCVHAQSTSKGHFELEYEERVMYTRTLSYEVLFYEIIMRENLYQAVRTKESHTCTRAGVARLELR